MTSIASPQARGQRLNARQQRFVAEYLIDSNAAGAARRAGYSERTARSIGARLLTHVDVAAAIESGQASTALKTEITQEWVIKKLLENLDGALEAKSWAAARRAVELLGRHIGMWPNRVQLTGADGGPIDVRHVPTLDVSKLTPDELETLIMLVSKAQPDAPGNVIDMPMRALTA